MKPFTPAPASPARAAELARIPLGSLRISAAALRWAGWPELATVLDECRELLDAKVTLHFGRMEGGAVQSFRDEETAAMEVPR